jgi:hypothetical protein
MTGRRGTAVLAVTLISAWLGAQAARPAAAAPVPLTWLAAGDSYSSGEGVAKVAPVNDNPCARSSEAYGPLAATDLQSDGIPTRVVHVACTGSLAYEFLCCASTANHGYGPQATESALALTPDDRFDVISMSFGGNDIGFSQIIYDCLAWAFNAKAWTALTARSPLCHVDYQELLKRIDDLVAGTSWADKNDGDGQDHPYVPNAAGNKVPLSDFYAYVANHMLTTNGVLVVVGYPQLFALSSQWNSVDRNSCQAIGPADADMLANVSAYLDNALRLAVDAARSKLQHGKIIYESLRDVYRGHELCSQPPSGVSPDNWVYLNGYLPLGNADSPLRHEASYHPDRAGQKATATKVANDVNAQLATTKVAPTPVPTVPTYSYLTTGHLSIVHGSHAFANASGSFNPYVKPRWTLDGNFTYAVEGDFQSATTIVALDDRSGQVRRVTCDCPTEWVAPIGASNIAWVDSKGRLTQLDLAASSGPTPARVTIPPRLPYEPAYAGPFAMNGTPGHVILAYPTENGSGNGNQQLSSVDLLTGNIHVLGSTNSFLGISSLAAATTTIYGGPRLAYDVAFAVGDENHGCVDEQREFHRIDLRNPSGGTSMPTDTSALASPSSSTVDGSGVGDIWWGPDGKLYAIMASWRCRTAAGAPDYGEPTYVTPPSLWRLDNTTWVRAEGGTVLAARQLDAQTRAPVIGPAAYGSTAGGALYTEIAGSRTKVADGVFAVSAPVLESGPGS